MSELADISLRPAFSDGMRSQLADRTTDILLAVGQLDRTVPSEVTRRAISELLSGMNSYYSNLIEGVKTLPYEIDAALEKSSQLAGSRAPNAELSRAHITVERAMRQRLADNSTAVYSSEFICWLHEQFYLAIPEPLRSTTTTEGNLLQIVPGDLRDRGVVVGKHHPPSVGELPHIMDAFQHYFGAGDWLRTEQLMFAAAAHHRLAWIHPFLDGNGRVARLFSHACLIRAGVDGSGLWSLSRGFARNR
ncbi:MAG: Fic family protein, partial [Verrucomicrobiota bacterium]